METQLGDDLRDVSLRFYGSFSIFEKVFNRQNNGKRNGIGQACKRALFSFGQVGYLG